MTSIVDMHMHTLLGAYDSSLDPEDLASEAKRVGLSGINITEHDRLWEQQALSRYRLDQAPLFVNNGMEVTTDMGHIIAVGLSAYVPGIRRLTELRRVADEAGAFLIAAHPFRHFFERAHFMRQGREHVEPVAEDLAKLAVFEHVDAIEALNGLNTPQENVMALRVANLLGKPVTGGSDCHSNHGIGYFCTVFERPVETPEQLLAELRAGRFHAAHDLPAGRVARFSETSLDGVAAD